MIDKYRNKVHGIDFQVYLDEIAELKKMSDVEELLSAVPAFDFTDVTILGYDLLEPHIDEVVAKLGNADGVMELPSGGVVSIYDDMLLLEVLADELYPTSYYIAAFEYAYGYTLGIAIQRVNGEETYEGQLGESWCSLPMSLGDTYEQWCELTGADLIKESPFVTIDENEWADIRYGTSCVKTEYRYLPDGIEPWNIPIDYYEEIYTDAVWNQYCYEFDMHASLYVTRADGKSFGVEAYFLDGSIQGIHYAHHYAKQL